ncbi:MAG: sulfatase [Opitutaceae bacterium]|nr:sulfatase [Opitutaceae bacterium]
MNQFIHLLAAAIPFMAVSVRAEERLNFVLILADDMGWTGVGCYGSPSYHTPNIDRLAREAMKFTQAYAAAPLCSPTRASILTGKYPGRLHLTDYIPGENFRYAKLLPPEWTKRLPAGEKTIAQRLKAAGYVTASIGKWHLGQDDARPEHHGFDFSVAGIGRGSPASYFSPYKNRYLKDGPKGQFLSDRLTDEARAWIETNKDKPFFLYLPHFAVHTPIQAKADVTEKYQREFAVHPRAMHSNPAYAALTESVDDSVGRVLAKLDELQLTGRTVVFFCSDNGGAIKFTSNAPLRSGKASNYEGGVRVPLLVRWPGVTKPGSTCDSPVISTDFYPTILEMAGVPADPADVCDGESIVPLLRQRRGLKRQEIYWHYPHYNNGNLGRAMPFTAVRQGDFKLLQFHEDGRLELYNLKEDIGETKNLAELRPKKVGELSSKIERWRKDVGAQMPSPNPNHDPAREAVYND